MSDAPSLVGRTLADRYRVESQIARGGMAVVYRARDLRLERDVAVKVLAPPDATDREFATRFLDEARAAASLSHPSLVHVYDSGSDGDAHYIVMELLDRHRALSEVIEQRGRLPRHEVVRIGRELLDGLRVVHERGLVHCDVKPANVMLGDGPAKLIDFGIATAPHDGTDGDTSIGSLRFMSPEQLHGQALTPASDLFSLGATLYQALTGQAPFAGATPQAVSAAHAADRVRPPSTLVEGIPGRLDAAILQSLRRDPESRFATASAMARALEAGAEEAAAQDDTTSVVAAAPRAAPPVPRRADAGYVPPPAPPPTRSRAPTAPRDSVARAPARPARPARRRAIPWSLIGTLLVFGAAALVVVLVVLPLLELGRQGGGTPTPVVDRTPEPGAQTVTVPDLVGMPTADAIDAANEAGLDWTVRCNEDPAQPEGIIDQEPQAGTQVARGSPFNLFSARIADCR